MNNSITVVGNLTRDPELKFLDSGTAAAKFSVAVTRKWKDRGGTEQEQTSFFDCSAMGSLAENIAGSLKKGDRAVVTGQMEQRTWEGKDGEKRYAFEIRCEAVGPDLRFAVSSTGPRTERRAPDFEDAF